MGRHLRAPAGASVLAARVQAIDPVPLQAVVPAIEKRVGDPGLLADGATLPTSAARWMTCRRQVSICRPGSSVRPLRREFLAELPLWEG
jgi:hypothetical protein